MKNYHKCWCFVFMFLLTPFISMAQKKVTYTSEVHKNHTNEIVFMSKDLGPNEVKEAYLKSEFTLGISCPEHIWIREWKILLQRQRRRMLNQMEIINGNSLVALLLPLP